MAIRDDLKLAAINVDEHLVESPSNCKICELGCRVVSFGGCWAHLGYLYLELLLIR